MLQTNLILLGVVLFCSACFAGEPSYHTARSEYLAGHYDQAYKIVSQLALVKSEVQARRMQAGLLFAGKGTERDIPRALELWEALASEGDTKSQSTLGGLFLDGAQVGGTDYPKALRYINLAADAGDAIALYNKGLIYQSGLGVERSVKQAKTYYMQAAEKGYGSAYLQLAGLADDLNGAINKVSACHYYEKAAQGGVPQGEFLYGKCLVTGDGGIKDITGAEKWYLAAAKMGLPIAQANLGYLYEKGEGVPLDHVAAYKWYWLASADVPSARKRMEALQQRDPQAVEGVNDPIKERWRNEIRTHIRKTLNARGQVFSNM
jgi:TPR repeat protein